MLEAVLTYLNNWFAHEIYTGQFSIEGGNLFPPILQVNQKFRIVGSVFNDGLHYCGERLTDEKFTGSVWALAVPKKIELLVEEITKWSEKNQPGAYTSESFGGYSYTRATNAKGVAVGWQDVFAAQLAPYRKLRDTSMVAPNPKGTPPTPRKSCWR